MERRAVTQSHEGAYGAASLSAGRSYRCKGHSWPTTASSKDTTSRTLSGMLCSVSTSFEIAADVIRTEYQRLRVLFGLTPVMLDVYVCDTTSSETTSLGSPVANCDPLYSGTRSQIVQPLTSAEDQWPSVLPLFPPTTFTKLSDVWPAWRIELWHEVVHQVSHDICGAWDPKEPPRTRANGSRSASGHGAGWFRGIQHAALKLSVGADDLDALLDQ